MKKISSSFFKTTFCLAALFCGASLAFADEPTETVTPAEAGAPAEAGTPARPQAPADERPVVTDETFSDLSLGKVKIMGGLSMDSEARMMNPVVGDFNGDGISDIIWGAPGVSIDGNTSAGAVFVLLGSAELSLKGQRDTTFKDAYDYRFDGTQKDGQLGLNVVAGDVNGDGISDIVVAEPGNKGALYVIFGGKALEKGHYTITDEKISDLIIYGVDHGSMLGTTLCVSDMNADGTEDLIFSSFGFNARGQVNSTDVTIIPSRRTWNTRTYKISDKIQGKVKLARSIALDVRAVHTCAVGDFNDDGMKDVALGMPIDSFGQRRNIGSVSLIYSPMRYSGGIVNLGEKSPGWGVKIYGDQENAMFGQSMTVGDFNGDSFDDLVIASPQRLVKGPESEGVVHFYSGKQLKNGNFRESFRFVGTGGMFGFNVQTLDVNRDNRSDLVISQPYTNSFGGISTGLTSVYLGGPHFSDSEGQPPSPDIRLAGRDFMQLGLGSAIGDFNGDGKPDWILRATADPYQRQKTGSLIVLSNTDEIPAQKSLTDDFLTILAPSRGGGLLSNGEAVKIGDELYETWFSPAAVGNRSVICLVKDRDAVLTRDLSSTGACDINIIGPDNGKIESYSFSDFNGDGKLELAMGMPNFNLPNATGAVVVVTLPDKLGPTLTIQLDPQNVHKSAWVFGLKDEDYSALGKKVEFRDINGDRIPELIIGAPKRRLDDATSGSLFIVSGEKSKKLGFYPLGNGNELTFEGIDNEEFGSDWIVMDFNLDGQFDILAIAEKTSNTLSEVYATLYAVLSPMRLPKAAYSVQSSDLKSMRITAPQSRAGLKIIHQLPDLNRDHAPDLVLLSPNNRMGLQKEGSVHVIFADKNNKTGTIDLSKETLSDILLSPERNERIVDVRFIDRMGRHTLLLSVATTLGVTRYDLYELLPHSVGEWEGQMSTGSLRSQLIKDATSESYQGLMLFEKRRIRDKEDEIWLLRPNAGDRCAGQGEAYPLD